MNPLADEQTAVILILTESERSGNQVIRFERPEYVSQHPNP